MGIKLGSSAYVSVALITRQNYLHTYGGEKCVSFFSVPATMPDETSPGCIPVPFLNKVKIVNTSVAGPV